MVTVDTSYAATAAKYGTRDINKLIAITKNNIASGSKLSSYSSSSQAWLNATALQTSIDQVLAAKVSMANTKSILDVAATGVTQIGKYLSDIASKLTAAINGADATKATQEIQVLQTQIKYTVTTATQNKVNLLNGTYGNLVLNYGPSGTTQNTHYLGPDVVYKVASSGNSGYLGGDNSVLDTQVNWQLVSNKTNAQAYLRVVNTAIQRNVVQLNRLQAYSDTMVTQSDFMDQLAASRSANLSRLVDADPDEEKLRLTALLARKQLLSQTLSMANASIANVSQNVLQLFKASSSTFKFT